MANIAPFSSGGAIRESAWLEMALLVYPRSRHFAVGERAARPHPQIFALPGHCAFLPVMLELPATRQFLRIAFGVSLERSIPDQLP